MKPLLAFALLLTASVLTGCGADEKHPSFNDFHLEQSPRARNRFLVTGCRYMGYGYYSDRHTQIDEIDASAAGKLYPLAELPHDWIWVKGEAIDTRKEAQP